MDTIDTTKIMTKKTIDDVRRFWDKNPLFTGESKFNPGTFEFFEEHRKIYIDDCFAGKLNPRLFPDPKSTKTVLDLGCGPGFWSTELAKQGYKNVCAADLTPNAINLTQQRAKLLGLNIKCQIENAEKLSFHDKQFDHVNCQGVIHHTPNTAACVKEIARVTKHQGTAIISVYYKNPFLRLWPVLRPIGSLLFFLGAKLQGRGRENIFNQSDVNEIVRLYDGEDNPIGKSYNHKEFRQLLDEHFEVEETFLHFFPARSLPFPIQKTLHRHLDKHLGFMIFAKCIKTGS